MSTSSLAPSPARPPRLGEEAKAYLTAYYTAALNEGLTPAPEDLTGWSAGVASVVGPGAHENEWRMHNPTRTDLAEGFYEVPLEVLLVCYAAGALIAPQRA